MHLLAGSAAAATPTCQDLRVSTPYQTPVEIQLACTDPDNDIVSYRAAGQAGDTIEITGSTVRFTPGAAVSGYETLFNYWARDSAGGEDVATVYVDVGPKPPPPSQNDPPVARCDSYRVEPGEILRVRRPGVLANDSDPDGDLLRAENQYGSQTNFPVPFVAYNGSFGFQAPDRRGMFSYRYVTTDGLLRAETTLTIWVGRPDGGCRAAFDPPSYSVGRTTSTLLKASGAVRVRVRGRWRRLGTRRRLRRPLMVDARRGSVRVRVVSQNNYERNVLSGRFAGGLFKLGTSVRIRGRLYSTFGTVELAGPRGCGGGAGPGRQLDVAAVTGFTIQAALLRVFTLSRPGAPKVSRFRVADRCDATSAVALRRGQIQVTDHPLRHGRVLRGRESYVARPR
jgi:hypothetical protein